MPSTKTIKLPVGSNFTIFSEYENNTNPIFRICSAGLSQTRNQLLCESVIQLVSEGSTLELVVLGKVNKYLKENILDSLEGACKSVISFTGEIAESDFSAYLNKSDLFCLIEYVDKKGEGGVGCKSGILAAAFGHGLPVVITGGSLTDDDILKQGENVWIVPYDKASIVTNIKLLMSDSKIRNRLSLGAKATFEKSMSWSQIYKNYIKHLENV
jgi:glycosyltransferase involved in cell wall biosynthesis